MDSISERVYKDFEPSWDWVPEEDCDTLLLYLPGFKKDQLRVQLSRTKNLIISGERQLEDNTWSRFRKQFAISNNCDLNGISARFDAGVLHVRQPKLIMPAGKQEEEEKPTITEPPKPRPMEEPKEHATSTANLTEPTNVKKNDELEAAKSVSKKEGEEEREMEKKKGKESESSSDSKSSQEQAETNAKSEDRKNLEEENESEKIARDGMEESGGGTGEGDVSGKTRVKKNRLGVGPVATEVKRLPKVMNLALAVLVVIVLGIYIINAIRYPMKAEK